MDRGGAKYSSALDPSNRNRSVNCSSSSGGDRIAASHDAADGEIEPVALANALSGARQKTKGNSSPSPPLHVDAYAHRPLSYPREEESA
jgi:hypothetical protein